MICWRYSCRFVHASPETSCCIHSGSDRAEISPITNKSLNLLTSWVSEILEHFACFWLLGKFLLACTVAAFIEEKLYFTAVFPNALFFIVPNQSCCVTKSNIPTGQSKSWKSYMAWCVAGHKAPFHGFGCLHYQPCRDHSPDKMVLKALRVSGFVLSAEGIILECSSPW